MDELPTPAEMDRADRLAIARGPADGYGLMRRAGAAVARELLARYADAVGFDVLCGPGNNGGDGYVVARLLAEAGCCVRVFAHGTPRPGADAARAEADCPLPAPPLSAFAGDRGRVVVDALFGAGLARALDGDALAAVRICREQGLRVVAVDLPSGVSGADGQAEGAAFEASLTITFARMKPGHLLLPGRCACGEIVVADIGISDAVFASLGIATFVNRPSLWGHGMPRLAIDTHKYRRGHVAVFGGGIASGGAARLAAMAAARAGAGAVTLLCPGSALAVNAAHLTAIMLARADDAGQVEAFVAARKVAAAVIGPGFGDMERLRAFVLALLAARRGPVLSGGVVLDADCFSAFGGDPAALFRMLHEGASDIPCAVLTPHEGEFGRLFPDLRHLPRLKRARAAAARAGAVVVLKGPDTVVAAPDGRAAIAENGTPLLATAGSGDVLAGIVAGLVAQAMPAFEAACAAVWLHAEAARAYGPGLIAEDLPGLLPAVLRDLHAA